MRDEALFHATLTVSSSACTGIELTLLGETSLLTHPDLLIINPLLGILCLGLAIYIERYLILTYDK